MKTKILQMKLTKERIEQLQKDLENAKTFEDLLGKDGAIKKLLEGEMTEHLGYEKRSDEAFTKILYLAYKGISKKWTMPVRNWAFIISQFSVSFQERLKSYI